MAKFLRWSLAAVALAAVMLYAAALALMFSEQRALLFIRGRHERARDTQYAVRTLTERDGTQLTVWEAPPPRPQAPVLVFFYGNGGTLSDFARIGETFLRQGYGVVLASYRGYSGNRGNPSEAGVMDDARAVLDSLGTTHGPVVLWGQSLGTGVAARMASEGRGALLILQSPYTSVADVAARRFPLFPVRWLIKDPFDTASLVPKIAVPVLIMSGTVDRTVPFDMGQTLAHRLGPKATFVPFPGQGHELSEFGVQAVADKWLHTQAAVLAVGN
jgi:pimeloyl-ACP methyl ester carboxylesterase